MATAPRPLPPYKMRAPGNLDPHKRPTVHNADGSISTVRTISAGMDNGEVLMPTVSPDGRILSDDAAIQRYLDTGENFGTFSTPEAATMFAERLHNSQAEEYGAGPKGKQITLEINGRDVEVDDSFLSLTPEQQNATVEEIAASLGARPAESAEANAAASQASQKLSGKVADLPSQRPTLGDEVMSFGRGVIEGIPIAGPMLADARRGLDANIGAMFQGRPAAELQAEYKAADDELAAETGGARFAGNIAGSVAALAPVGMTAVGGRLLGMTGGFGSRVGLGTVSGSAISAADTAARGGSLADVGTSAGIGGAIGGLVPFAGAAVRRAVTPVAGNASKAAAADVLQREGVDLTAGQRTGSKGLQYREAELGGNSADNFIEQQADQFTAAALRRIGVNAPRATPDVIDAAHTNIGQMFDDLAARNGLQTDPRMLQDLQRAATHFENITNPSTRPPFVQNFMRDIQARLANGYAFLDGEWYKSTRSELGRLASGSSNPEFAEALRDIQAALDNAMERSLRATNPADLGAWQEARRLYRNLLVIDDATARAGEKAADGIITPANLRGAAMRQNKKGFVRGRGDFAELANAGVSAMSPLPNSGTPGRLGAKVLLPAGAVAGGTIGAGVAGPVGALVGGAVGAAVPWAAGRAILSGPGRAYLGNQLLPGLGNARLPPAVLALLGTDER